MARDTINLGAAPDDGNGDDLRAAGAKLNANVAKDEALQSAVGAAEGVANLGALTLAAGTLGATETVKTAVEKIQGNVNAAALLQQVANRTANELGDDYDYEAAADSIIGTTNVTSAGQAIALNYPDGAGIYTLLTIRSGGGGGAEHRQRIVLIFKGLRAWVRLRSEGVWSDSAEVAGAGAEDLVTQADSERTAYSVTGLDWREQLASGLYAGTYTNAQATTFELPNDGRPTSDIEWTVKIVRTGTLTGTAIASAQYTHTEDSADRVHQFVAALTLASGVATSWTVGTWEGVTPRNAPPQSIHEEALRYYGWTLTAPSGLTQTFPSSPVREQSGWTGTMSVQDIRPSATGVTYYVDGMLGNDANDGLTESTPKETITAVMTLNPGLVYVAPGIYRYASNGSTSTSSLADNQIFQLRAWKIRPGRPVLAATQGTTFTAVGGGTPNVYSVTQSFMRGAVDLAYADEHGCPMVYAEVTSAAECDDNPGTWFDAGSNTMYVHPFGGGEPGLTILPIRQAAAYAFRDDQSVYLEGIDFIGGNQCVSFVNDSGVAAGQLLTLGCRFLSVGGGSGIFTRGCQEVVNQFSRADNCAQDGFNYNQFDATVQTERVVEIGCHAWGNGYAISADTANGFTVHDDTECIRIACTAGDNRGPQYADTGGSKSWNVGCFAGATAAFAQDAQASGFQATQANTEVYLYECQASGSFADVAVDGSASLLTDRSSFATSSGTIGSYDQN